MSNENKSVGPINAFVAWRIRELRLTRNLSSKELAQRIGLPPGSYSCLENGFYNISLENLFKILQALQAGPQEIWPRSGSRAAELIDDDFLRSAADDTRSRILRGRPRIDDILEAVCEAFDLSKGMLLAGVRGWEPVRQGRTACAILVEETPGLSLKSLSSALGCTTSTLRYLLSRVAPCFEGESWLGERLQHAREVLVAEGRAGGEPEPERWTAAESAGERS